MAFNQCLDIAPRIFMQFMCPLIAFWRVHATAAFVHLDDIFIVC